MRQDVQQVGRRRGVTHTVSHHHGNLCGTVRQSLQFSRGERHAPDAVSDSTGVCNGAHRDRYRAVEQIRCTGNIGIRTGFCSIEILVSAKQGIDQQRRQGMDPHRCCSTAADGVTGGVGHRGTDVQRTVEQARQSELRNRHTEGAVGFHQRRQGISAHVQGHR
ncbi:hypothetical protein SRABI106_03389 [Rahnella aquatilis]|nr:hypothetical protein SRABI106_03389 [Rahnella aquatilis]